MLARQGQLRLRGGFPARVGDGPPVAWPEARTKDKAQGVRRVDLDVVKLRDPVARLQAGRGRGPVLLERDDLAARGKVVERGKLRTELSGGCSQRRDDDLPVLQDLLDHVLDVGDVEAKPADP